MTRTTGIEGISSIVWQESCPRLKRTVTRGFSYRTMPIFYFESRQSRDPLATVMRRLLTGYAVSFNRRHKRQGELFQNRYKSIVCQKDAYLKEFVRYIHLNPVRAGIIQNLKKLNRYAYCGHSAVMGKKKGPDHCT